MRRACPVPRPLRTCWLHAALLAGWLQPAAAALPDTPVLPAAIAVAAAQAASRACLARGVPVAAAVVSPSGTLRVLIADERVKDIDVESARRKARTAAVLDAPTAAVAAAVDHAPAYGRLLTALDGTLFFVGGGLPIHAGHDLVGAIGVGGAPGGAQDASCAQAGLDAIAAQLR